MKTLSLSRDRELLPFCLAASTAALDEAAIVTDSEDQPDRPGTPDESHELAVAEAESATPNLRLPDIETLDRETILAAIREVFSTSAQLDAEAAIPAVTRALGYARTGSRIYDNLKNNLRVAVQRGILRNEQGAYRIACRTINDYSQDERIAALLSALPRAWTPRPEAIRAAARHLGFRRTGAQIQDAFKSAINGALRRKLLEADKDRIRKMSPGVSG